MKTFLNLMFVYLSILLPYLVLLPHAGSQDLCKPGKSPQNGVWHCLTNEDRAICHLSCFPGFVPTNRSRTFCIADVWDIPPESLSCSAAAALIVGGSRSSSGQLYDQFGQSISLPTLPGSKEYNSADFVDGQLIVCGQSDCLVLHLDLWEWREFPSLQLNHIGGTSSVSYSTLYLIGGETSSYEFYDSYEGSDWLLGGKISANGIGGACAAPYSSSHLITGGINTPHSAVLYNLIDGEERVLPDMLFPTQGHGCVPCTDPVTGHYGVLVAGGSPFYRLAQFLDMSLGNWRQVGSLQADKVGVSRMLVMDQKIYIFGGYDSEGDEQDSVEVYDFLTNSWTLAATMDQPRAEHGVAAVPNRWMQIINKV